MFFKLLVSWRSGLLWCNMAANQYVIWRGRLYWLVCRTHNPEEGYKVQYLITSPSAQISPTMLCSWGWILIKVSFLHILHTIHTNGLQLFLNSPARAVIKTSKFYIISILKYLHWSRRNKRIKSAFTLTYNALWTEYVFLSFILHLIAKYVHPIGIFLYWESFFCFMSYLFRYHSSSSHSCQFHCIGSDFKYNV